MIGFTLPEIRRLLTKLILRVTDAAEHIWTWSRFGADGNTKPGSATTNDVATHSSDCRCSTNLGLRS